MKKLNKMLIFNFAAFFLLISTSVMADQYVMKIASAGPMSAGTLSAPTFFKSAIERQTSGRITVELYDSAQMGSENDVFIKTQMGALQGGMTSVFETSRHSTPHLLVSMLPFVWTEENFDQFMKSEAYQPFLKSLDQQGLTMLGFTNVDYYGFITTEPIAKLEDLKKAGKIRVTESPMERSVLNSFGGTPSVMAWGEVYQALQQRVINGVNHSAEFLVAAKLHEPCKYYTDLKHLFPQSCFYVNSNWLNSLPEDLNKLVIINGEAACNAARNLSHLKRKIAIDLMKVSGIEIIVPQKADMENFRKAADIVHKEYEKKIGKEYLQKIYELTGYAPY